MADFPSIRPSSSKWGLVTNTQRHISSLSRQTQVLELPGAKWEATLQFNQLNVAEGRQILAFLASLRGSVNTFNLHDHSLELPRGVGTGTPLVNGASQSGNTLITDGWTVSQTGILLTGDLFQVGTELKIITSDVNSDGSGNATLAFESPLRASPANNDPLTVNSPKALMMLKDDKQAVVSLSSPTFHTLKLTCIEAI